MLGWNGFSAAVCFIASCCLFCFCLFQGGVITSISCQTGCRPGCTSPEFTGQRPVATGTGAGVWRSTETEWQCFQGGQFSDICCGINKETGLLEALQRAKEQTPSAVKAMVELNSELISLQKLQERFNTSQADAICMVSRCSLEAAATPRICLLQGPPGTGKSHNHSGDS